MKTRIVVSSFFLVGMFGLAIGQAHEAIPNWPAPATWTPPSSESGGKIHALSQMSSLPFIAVTPCRMADTRTGSGFTGEYGPPSIPGGMTRTMTVAGQCGVVSGAAAVSLNVTITSITQPGDVRLYPAGGSFLVSTQNWTASTGVIANAAVVQLSAAGQITIQIDGSASVDVIVDVNGYYAGAGTASRANTFLGSNAGNSTMTGAFNTAVGASALSGNDTGSANIAVGGSALFSNTTGNGNTAVGYQALLSNIDGISNTASGLNALALNTSGSSNTANGVLTLNGNTTGSLNTASGRAALYSNTTGSFNIAIGSNAGQNLTTGDGNICIGNDGVAGEAGTIRIGQVQTRTFIAGIRDITTGGVAIPVLIDQSGQLGTMSSSARVKEQIRDMGDVSNALLNLRPVTFRYKGQAGSNLLHFGLIAEEVDEVLPELVVHRFSGEAETVLYHEMPAMLLNELQKQQRVIRALEARLLELEARVQNGKSGS